MEANPYLFRDTQETWGGLPAGFGEGLKNKLAQDKISKLESALAAFGLLGVVLFLGLRLPATASSQPQSSEIIPQAYLPIVTGCRVSLDYMFGYRHLENELSLHVARASCSDVTARIAGAQFAGTRPKGAWKEVAPGKVVLDTSQVNFDTPNCDVDANIAGCPSVEIGDNNGDGRAGEGDCEELELYSSDQEGNPIGDSRIVFEDCALPPPRP